MKRWLELSPLYQTAASTGSKLYPSNMQRMLIKDLIHAQFFSCTAKLEQVKEGLCGRGAGGGVAFIIKKNCPDMIKGSFYVRICFRIVKIKNQSNKVRDIKWLFVLIYIESWQQLLT